MQQQSIVVAGCLHCVGGFDLFIAVMLMLLWIIGLLNGDNL